MTDQEGTGTGGTLPPETIEALRDFAAQEWNSGNDALAGVLAEIAEQGPLVPGDCLAYDAVLEHRMAVLDAEYDQFHRVV